MPVGFLVNESGGLLVHLWMRIRLVITGKSFLETDHECEYQYFSPCGMSCLLVVAEPWAPSLELNLTQDMDPASSCSCLSLGSQPKLVATCH